MLEDCGYRRLSNPLDKRGRWMIGGQRVGGVYVRNGLLDREAIAAAEALKMCEIEHGGRIGRIVFLCITPNPSQAPSVKTPRSARTRVEKRDKREMRPMRPNGPRRGAKKEP